MDYKEIEQEMEKTYDGIAYKYLNEAKNDWNDKRYVDRFISYLPSNSSILDIGCGTGELLEYFSSLGFKTTGIDISQKMVDISKKRVVNSLVLKMSLYDIFKIHECYDAVVATFLFVHIPKEKICDVIKSINDKLKKGGIFFTVFTTSLKEGLQEEILDNNYKYYAVNYSKDEIIKELNNNGMEILDIFSNVNINNVLADIIIAKKI